VKENTLLRISLAGSVMGLVALYFIVLNISSPAVKIGEVTGNLAGSAVKIHGEVRDFYEHSNGHYFFTLADETGGIRVVIWQDILEELSLGGMDVSRIRDGTELEITGTVELYRGELELIPLRSQVSIAGSP
jgi:exonuclease VII large subunit